MTAKVYNRLYVRLTFKFRLVSYNSSIGLCFFGLEVCKAMSSLLIGVELTPYAMGGLHNRM